MSSPGKITTIIVALGQLMFLCLLFYFLTGWKFLLNLAGILSPCGLWAICSWFKGPYYNPFDRD